MFWGFIDYLMGLFFKNFRFLYITGRYCFGVDDTLKACEMGAAEKLIVYENLDICRIVLKHPVTNRMIAI